MASQFETPFVPQQPLLKVEAGMQRPREPVNLSLVLSLLIFFVILALTGGTYFYIYKLGMEISTSNTKLVESEKLFDVSKIAVYKDLQDKLTTAKSLVDSHTIFSLVFNLIEKNAAENIGLTSLSFKQEDLVATLELTGQAPSYGAAYYQVQKWREAKPEIKNVEVTSISLEETSGIVIFAVKMSIDASTLGYAKMLAASKPEVPVITTPTPSANTKNSTDDAFDVLTSTDQKTLRATSTKSR